MPRPLPLDLYAEVETADGTRYKWDANQAPGSRLTGFSYREKIGEGFSDGGGQLARLIDQDYPDIGLVNSVTVVGADGSVAYEGRQAALPRDLGDRHSVGVTLAGWMAHAKDRKFQEVYVDRDMSRWRGMSLAERATLVGTYDTASFSYNLDGQALTCALPNQALGAQVVTEAWYSAPSGCTIARIAYQGTQALPAGYRAPLIISSAGDPASGTSSITATMDNTVRTATLTAQPYVFVDVYSNATAATPASGSHRTWSKLAMYGSHGLTLRTGESGEPDGVYGSDVIRDIASRFCPMLNTNGVQDTDYVIQHLSFNDRTYPFDAFLEINKYHLWHLGVWDNKRLDFRPYDLTDYDWEIRTDDPGTTFSPQGPSTEDLFNGIAVLYTDVLTGVPYVITPETNSELSDTSSTNPWNAWGIAHWDEIALSAPTTAASAAEIGRAALADRNRPRTPGTITVTGYVRDRAGNLQPAWKPRAGETIAITNFPNDMPRLIVEKDFDDESKTLKIAIDKPFALVDAYLDRVNNALGARGLS